MREEQYNKAIVIDIQKKYIIALSPDGHFFRLKYKEGLDVGDEIYYLESDLYNDRPKVREVNFRPIVRTILIAALVILGINIGYRYFNTDENVYAAVSFGSQAGVQVELNENQEIIQLYNQKGEAVEDQLVGRPIEEATSYLLDTYGDAGNSWDSLVGLSSDDSQWINSYENYLVEGAAEYDTSRNLIVIKGNLSDYELAKEDQQLIGSYQLAEADIELWQGEEAKVLSVKEKRDRLGGEANYYELADASPLSSIIQSLDRINRRANQRFNPWIKGIAEAQRRANKQHEGEFREGDDWKDDFYEDGNQPSNEGDYVAPQPAPAPAPYYDDDDWDDWDDYGGGYDDDWDDDYDD